MDVTESKAMVGRIQGISNQLKKNSVKILILTFPGRDTWHLIEQLRYVVDNIFGNAETIIDKKIIFLALYTAKDFNRPTVDDGNSAKISQEISTSINFMTKDWSMLSIDDLHDTDYEGFFQIMKLSV